MRVKDLLTSDVKSCGPDEDLARAAQIMWDCDCGVVPVVDDDRRVIGMITDRDICIAAATRSAVPSNIRVRDVMSRAVHSCRLDDDVRTVLKTMKAERVRRLPVMDGRSRLAGIVSMNDLVLQAEYRKEADVPGEELLETLKSISAHSAQPVTA